jgi:hypothetical protein
VGGDLYMATLIINAPKKGTKRSFEEVIKTGYAVGYAISRKDYQKLMPKTSEVIIIRKNFKYEKRAEGILYKIEEGGKTPQGVQRYNIWIKDIKLVNYMSEKINRFGVAVI